jgi:hypothetical protein
MLAFLGRNISPNGGNYNFGCQLTLTRHGCDGRNNATRNWGIKWPQWLVEAANFFESGSYTWPAVTLCSHLPTSCDDKALLTSGWGLMQGILMMTPASHCKMLTRLDNRLLGSQEAG